MDENGEVLVEAENHCRPPKGDPTQHAETVAVRRVARIVSPERLAKATLYTSAEPCSHVRRRHLLDEHRPRGLRAFRKEATQMTGANEENPTFSLPCREVFARGQRRVEIAGPLIEEEVCKTARRFLALMRRRSDGIELPPVIIWHGIWVYRT